MSSNWSNHSINTKSHYKTRYITQYKDNETMKWLYVDFKMVRGCDTCDGKTDRKIRVIAFSSNLFSLIDKFFSKQFIKHLLKYKKFYYYQYLKLDKIRTEKYNKLGNEISKYKIIHEENKKYINGEIKWFQKRKPKIY